MNPKLLSKVYSLNFICSLFFICTCMYSAKAQDALVASGGNATGSSGMASYTIGQITQTTLTNSNGSVIQGIQFYFESSTLQIIDLETNLDISTYPNPATSILNMNVEDYSPNTLSYDLIDLTGKLITSGKIINKTTSIDVDYLDMAIYLLNVHNKTNQTTKTFKIIKK